MAQRSRVREITIVGDKGTFAFFKKSSVTKKDYDFEGLSAVRNLLSNEKARILHVIKTKSPKSIYDLSKILERNFKSVSDDIKLLERFGFIDLIAEKTGKRERLRPIIVVDLIRLDIMV